MAIHLSMVSDAIYRNTGQCYLFLPGPGNRWVAGTEYRLGQKMAPKTKFEEIGKRFVVEEKWD